MEVNELVNLLIEKKQEKAQVGIIAFDKPLVNSDGDKIRSVFYMPENEALYVYMKFKHSREYERVRFNYLNETTKQLILNNVK